jgi:hypothetical protein
VFSSGDLVALCWLSFVNLSISHVCVPLAVLERHFPGPCKHLYRVWQHGRPA